MAIEKVFTEVNALADIDKLRIGIPMIGAGLAGGDWDIIEKIINRVTRNMNITLVKYKG
jgi:hypothetical protein